MNWKRSAVVALPLLMLAGVDVATLPSGLTTGRAELSLQATWTCRTAAEDGDVLDSAAPGRCVRHLLGAQP